MKYLVVLFSTILILGSCSLKKDQPNDTIKVDTIPVLDSLSESVAQEKADSVKSQIINPNFDKTLLFGIWGHSLDDPACDFEINEERFLICDYDGDGTRTYLITGDSIFLNNPEAIFKGKIIKVTQDSLIIHWQQNDNPEVLLRWSSED